MHRKEFELDGDPDYRRFATDKVWYRLRPGEDGGEMFTDACDYCTATPGPLEFVLEEL